MYYYPSSRPMSFFSHFHPLEDKVSKISARLQYSLSRAHARSVKHTQTHMFKKPLDDIQSEQGFVNSSYVL